MTAFRLVLAPPPPPRVPRAITADTVVDGVRLILVPAPPADVIRDIRGTGRPFRTSDGILRVRVVTEAAWYRMRDGGAVAELHEAQTYAVDQLWVE